MRASLQATAAARTALHGSHFDVAFMSNYLEHLPSSGCAVLAAVAQVREVLRPGGRLIVLQPNIRFVGGRLLGLPRPQGGLTDRSLAEACGDLGSTLSG